MEFFIFIIIAFVIIVIFGILGANYEKEKAEQRRNVIKNKVNDVSGFQASVSVSGVKNMYVFSVDKNSKQVLFVNESTKKLIPFDKIISVELLEDNTTILSKSLLRTVGGGVVGGAIAGGAGAIIGGLSGNQKQNKEVSKVQVKIKLRDISDSSFVINCFDCRTMTTEHKAAIKPSSMEGYIYEQGLNHAKKICDIISVIIDETNHVQSDTSTKEVSNSSSTIEELEKLAALKEKGMLTDEEFQKMKNSIITGNSPKATLQSDADSNLKMEEDVPQEIYDAIAKNQLIVAIKLYRDYKQCSLEEAKEFIDNHK